MVLALILAIYAYRACDEQRIFAMRTVIFLAVEYAYRILILPRQAAEELAEARLILLSHLRSGRHGEYVSAKRVSKRWDN